MAWSRKSKGQRFLLGSWNYNTGIVNHEMLSFTVWTQNNRSSFTHCLFFFFFPQGYSSPSSVAQLNSLYQYRNTPTEQNHKIRTTSVSGRGSLKHIQNYCLGNQQTIITTGAVITFQINDMFCSDNFYKTNSLTWVFSLSIFKFRKIILSKKLHPLFLKRSLTDGHNH